MYSTEAGGRRRSDAGRGVGCNDAQGGSKSDNKGQGDTNINNEEENGPDIDEEGSSVNVGDSASEHSANDHNVGGAPSNDVRWATSVEGPGEPGR